MKLRSCSRATTSAIRGPSLGPCRPYLPCKPLAPAPCGPCPTCKLHSQQRQVAALNGKPETSSTLLAADISSPGVASQSGSIWSAWWLQRQTLVMFCAGAVLGPFLDGMHSSNNVLHYHDPFILSVGDWSLESCWWVPVLFGVAGAIIGVGVPVLDAYITQGDKQDAPAPAQAIYAGSLPTLGWPKVLLCIALFVTQYGLSGRLADPLRGTPGALDAVLIAYAAAHFAWFDRSAAGLALSLATMIGGPLIEVFLVNVPQLYHYEHPDLWGIPTWIPWVYFCGGPAVGNLGRIVSSTLLEQQRKQWMKL